MKENRYSGMSQQHIVNRVLLCGAFEHTFTGQEKVWGQPHTFTIQFFRLGYTNGPWDVVIKSCGEAHRVKNVTWAQVKRFICANYPN